ncbi:SpoIIE family protein phosphatase, partial [Streptomyces sp. URMC 129]|uniref:SpoIIE family protein phosphatase n=1 Tax=Streptomyces sp. URMC 129 TaxID=3423407 RepID=UPI003F1CF8E2
MRDERLRMLEEMGEEQGDSEVLSAALQHAAVEFGALGGMAHPEAGSQERAPLRLIAATGLPPVFTDYWRDVAKSGASAPARAFREGGFVWLPAIAPPEQGFEGRELPDRLPGVPEGAQIVAVPLMVPERVFGALSLVLPPSAGEPDAGSREFFLAVGRWAGGRVRRVAPEPEAVPEAMLAAEPGPGQRQALDAVSVGTWSFDPRAGMISLDETLLKQIGVAPENLDGRIETWVDRFHPDDRAWVLPMSEESMRTRRPIEYEFRVRRDDGTYAWVRVRSGVALDENGEVERQLGTIWDTSRAHAASESVSRALRHMNDGFLSVDAEWRIEFVNVAAQRLLGRAAGLTGRRLWDVPAVREVPGLEERSREAVATGTPGGFDTPWPGGDRWYHVRLVPLPGEGLTYYITDITERRLRAAAQRAAAERAELVGQLTRRLAEAVTARDVVAAVAKSILPALGADGLTVLAMEGGRVSVVGSVGYPADFLEKLHGLPTEVATPLSEALRTRGPQFLDSPEAYRQAFPETADLAALGGKQAWAFLPLSVPGHDIGTVTVSFDHPRRLDDDERTLLTAVSGLIAQALERAGLYDEAVTRARALQRALLPRALPALPAAVSAARYLPAGAATEVGGDWYDVIPLSAARVALVIGDVMGHGMAEAATMGRLRTAVRTLTDLELPPEEILDHLNAIVADLGEERFATCLYGVYDPVTGHFTHASAGHPPPAITHPDGTTTYP